MKLIDCPDGVIKPMLFRGLDSDGVWQYGRLAESEWRNAFKDWMGVEFYIFNESGFHAIDVKTLAYEACDLDINNKLYLNIFKLNLCPITSDAIAVDN
jgi:hypothetical protein